MKTPDEALSDLHRRLARRWHEDVTNSESGGWPYEVSLGRPAKAVLEGNFEAARRWALTWRDWACQCDVQLRWQDRIVIGTRQSLPTHLLIPDIDKAARLVGKPWPLRLAAARSRLTDLQRLFPMADMPATIRRVAPLGDVDFDLLCRAATWFAEHDASGLTARQVPIEGLHGKWLNHNIALVRELARKDDFGLIDRPRRVRFTYLDPDHLAAGGRKHDSTTIGDVQTVAFEPKAVIITENKDTTVFFPDVPGGIAIEGGGFEGTTKLADIDWLRVCPRVLYWGDIDAVGYEIVSLLRAYGVQAQTILMDEQTFAAYEKYGAWTDRHGQPIKCSTRKSLPHLSDEERVMYERVTEPTWDRVRRIEQERIPLHIAQQLVVGLD